MLHKSDINRMLSNRAVITKCDEVLAPTSEISRLGNEFYLRTQGNLEIITTENIPKNLSDNQKRLLKEFNEELDTRNSPEKSGFFSKVKDFWDGLT